ncbi:MAG TPA: hypothetical protein IAA40_07985 [Candidatus Olsenella excrementigallinarum]|nr:hypothetical protein [Candidatus Olsenella excrementigallinarum]
MAAALFLEAWMEKPFLSMEQQIALRREREILVTGPGVTVPDGLLCMRSGGAESKE